MKELQIQFTQTPQTIKSKFKSVNSTDINFSKFIKDYHNQFLIQSEKAHEIAIISDKFSSIRLREF